MSKLKFTICTKKFIMFFIIQHNLLDFMYNQKFKLTEKSD